MPLEVGSIVEGKITGITKFGAFIELPENKTGMVHISEVAATYVKEITEFLAEGQTVKVRILAIAPDGKINLSIKRAVEHPAAPPQFVPRNNAAPRGAAPRSPSPRRRYNAEVDYSKSAPAPQTFEDMLSRFKQTSDERISDVKKGIDSKRGSSVRKRNT